MGPVASDNHYVQPQQEMCQTSTGMVYPCNRSCGPGPVDTSGLIVVFGFLGCLITGLFIWIYFMSRWSQQWHTIATGIFDRAEYGEYKVRRRSGSMVHTTRTVIMDTTIIFFDDGRSYELGGRRDIPFPKSTKINILENKMGSRKLEVDHELHSD